jgi:hypothetical protein
MEKLSLAPDVQNSGIMETIFSEELFSSLPDDNTPEGLQALLTANAEARLSPWLPPFDDTHYTLHLGDARNSSPVTPTVSWSILSNFLPTMLYP